MSTEHTHPTEPLSWTREMSQQVQPIMTYSRRRRKTRLVSQPGELKPILTTPEQQEESITNAQMEQQEATNLVSNTAQKLENFSLTKGIDQIRSELDEENFSALVESDYWDESHSWGADSEAESDDYWHFLGKYE